MLKKITVIIVLIISCSSIYAAANEEKYVVLADKKNTHEAGKVKMVVFFDFFCPHCHEFDSVVISLLQREYGDKLDITFKGLPIIYEDSIVPIEAFELAKDAGKGRQMKDAIFDAIYYQRKDGADRDLLVSIAKSLGMDGEKFKKDLAAGVKKKIVLEGKELAMSYGAKGTPTVIIDGNILIKDISLATISSLTARILKEDKK